MFDKLMVCIGKKYPEFNSQRRTDRMNTVGGGRPYSWGLRERVLLFLLYYRQYVTESLAGFIFDLHESGVCPNIPLLAPLMESCLPTPAKIYQKAGRVSVLEGFLLFYPDAMIFVTQPSGEIPCPEHRRRRKSRYSGKKKKQPAKYRSTKSSDGRRKRK